MIGGGELVVIAATGLMLLLALGAIVALVVWGRWVARRQGGGAWSAAAWMPVVALLMHVGGGCVASAMLAYAFEDVSSVAVEQRAAALASMISATMNMSAVVWGLAMLLLVASIVICTVGTVRAPAIGAETGSRARER